MVGDMHGAFQVDQYPIGFVARLVAFDPDDALLSGPRHVALADGGALRQHKHLESSLLPAGGLRAGDGNRIAGIGGRQFDFGMAPSSCPGNEEYCSDQRDPRERGLARTGGATASRAVCRQPNADSSHPGERRQRIGFLAG